MPIFATRAFHIDGPAPSPSERVRVRRAPIVMALVLTLLAGACGSNGAAPQASSSAGSTSPVIAPAAIEAHMRFLASDLMEGREAGTRGFDLAANYVAAQFRLLGLAPLGDMDGSTRSYFQQVPLQAHWLVKPASRMAVRGSTRTTRLTLGKEFVVSSSPIYTSSMAAAPAVFAGYGIEAPGFSHNDYAGLDVRGKVVVVLTGYPASMPSEEGAHYGSGREKQRTAASHGAVALVSVYTERFEKVSPWDRNVDSLDSMSMSWVAPDGKAFVAAPQLQAAALMSPADGALLFDGAPKSYAEVRTEAVKGAPQGFPLAVSIELAQQSRHERRSSVNVAGVLPGADAALRNEHVVVLAHLDHEGIGLPVNGDRIYNGAMDNAAGIAGMLEAARAITGAATPPRRSVLFLAVTAEEKGLIGSEYFARNPPIPVGSLVAAVNIDMPILTYPFTDVIAFGANHSSLQAVTAAAAARVGVTLSPDPMPDQALFTRSDHYRFVQQGVPSIFLSTGWNTAAGAGEGGKAFNDFLESHYHRPSDDLNLPIDYAAGAKFAQVNYEILTGIANADARPRWNDGDFFGGLFAARP
jgi:Zn-dependent M28 family amino/carboxypeptidase